MGMIHWVLFLFAFLVTLLDHLVSPTTNLCSSQGLCCKHRDSGCVIQNIFANHSVDTSSLPCYCDHACLRLDDCCPDYRDFCSVKDCVLSEWGPWTQCPFETIDNDLASSSYEAIQDGCNYTTKQGRHVGFSERHRVVLHQAMNGGRKCPSLVQRKLCPNPKRNCRPTINDANPGSSVEDMGRARLAPNENVAVEALADHQVEHPLTFVKFHSPTTMMNDAVSSYPDEELRGGHGQSSSQTLDESAEQTFSCLEMVIIRASHGCQGHDKRLHIGTRICIQCPTKIAQRAPATSTVEKNGFMCPNSTSSMDDQLIGLIQKFRIDEHCFGKLTYLAIRDSREEDCPCEDGLQFRVIA
ncbi:hypothetical protein TCAL_10842 [Tigriopus californicus]|uniref:SMB domain-containing protein n=1 Tax=Tigriopus californicus TaxID=6832 RepID=A0A553NWX5_TIGCA|nr:uncharacterized protein LOC131887066 [Tigriopus californicus]TRY69936.1 hypothetical protein TCAL_10842 [Tigriopus californicus]|eukprot:TCALIF_10842-PA protein Name:"Similar to SBSPON Somatomedin-B and thrombospondin type-1 domain-containing protein (Homo sapiens)" AED:0.00 eAED:0.00 QI:108/1/1/1/0.75/0.8/5/99/354